MQFLFLGAFFFYTRYGCYGQGQIKKNKAL